MDQQVKVQLQKGPTITPAIFPQVNPISNEVTIVGFSGLSELDFATLMILQAMIQRYDPSEVNVVPLAINMAMQTLGALNEVSQKAIAKQSRTTNQLDTPGI